NFPGLSPSPADLDALSAAIEQTHASWIVLAGSVPPGVSTEIYRELTRMAKSWGCKVALDASGEALRSSLDAPRDALPHLVKPNLAELEEWLGESLSSPTAILQAANNLLERGIEQVAVSMGGDGVLLVSRQGAVWATPPAIEVGSTVGAGDALVAGLVAASIRGLSQSESAILGTSFSLDALTHNGVYGLSEDPAKNWSGRIAVRPLVSVRGSPKVMAALPTPVWSQPAREVKKSISLAEPI
ncbi:hypothetical protein EON80_33040, partial [bacterium]